jgi:predicted nucleic acid-binding protein
VLIFLDANILFSVAKSDGAIRRLLNLLREAGHECWADSYVIEEARRNLLLKYPKEAAALDRLLGKIRIVSTATSAGNLPELMRIPEKDRLVLAAAIRHGCDAFVTGDRTHFGALFGTTLNGVAIHSPRSLAEAYSIS